MHSYFIECLSKCESLSTIMAAKVKDQNRKQKHFAVKQRINLNWFLR